MPAKLTYRARPKWWIVLFVVWCMEGPCATAIPLLPSVSIDQDVFVANISRHNDGDTFRSTSDQCETDTCIGLSSGTAASKNEEYCTCQCLNHLPTFRDDLNICVDDIHECPLAPFVSGSTTQQIPFVFLPLKGQIIHPSKEISIAAIQNPLCAVSGAQFLSHNGWVDLRSPLDADVPFRVFRDEGRTFLQWLGDSELRIRMTGRILLVHMICRDMTPSLELPEGGQAMMTPCVAFRVVGTPIKYQTNVSEVMFSPDTPQSSGMSSNEYIAMGVCSVLLGLIYVASVFLYLHIRKKRKANGSGNDTTPNDAKEITADDIVVKRNPLLGMGRHFSGMDNTTFSDTASNTSENEHLPDVVTRNDEMRQNSRKMVQTAQPHTQITSAVVHSNQQEQNFFLSSPSRSNRRSQPEAWFQESSTTIERLPDEDVSIVETTHDYRESDKPASIKAIATNQRRKLYFNPAYFDPQLLATPPPAAIEFLTKIREVITIAKQKMATKKFTPSLALIPEEDPSRTDPNHALSGCRPLKKSVSLKRVNSRKQSNRKDVDELETDIEIPLIPACKSCSSANDSKKQTIHRWLEDVKNLKAHGSTYGLHTTHSTHSEDPRMFSSYLNNRLKSTFDQIPNNNVDDDPFTITRNYPTRFALEVSPLQSRKPPSKKLRKRMAVPPPVAPTKMAHDLPDMINEAIEIENNRNMDKTSRKVESSTDSSNANTFNEYETDSLERGKKRWTSPNSTEFSTPSQPSPSLSVALPINEELTMQNAVYNLKSVKSNEYESIDGQGFLPELLIQTEYSLVSEVYVNNGYNESPMSSPGSDGSSKARIHYVEPEKPGHLLIEVNDCSGNYVRINETDNFEPDTLERKPSKLKIHYTDKKDMTEFEEALNKPADNQIVLRRGCQSTDGNFSLPASHIMLQTTPSYNSEDYRNVSYLSKMAELPMMSLLHKNFGSLREIYEEKAKMKRRPNIGAFNFTDVDSRNSTLSWKCESEDDEGRILTLEERHSKRQRKSTPVKPPALKEQQPDVIPPLPPKHSPIYQCPKPPRKVTNDSHKPPLPPKNAIGRSTESLVSHIEVDGSTSPRQLQDTVGTSATRHGEVSQFVSNLGQKQWRFYKPYDVRYPDEPRSLDVESNIYQTIDEGHYSSIYEDSLDRKTLKRSNSCNERNLCDSMKRINNQNFYSNVHDFKTSTSDQTGKSTLKNGLDERTYMNITKDYFRIKVPSPDYIEPIRNGSVIRDLGIGHDNFEASEHNDSIKRTWQKLLQLTSPREDSGYLSTDSNDSRRHVQDSVSETDESVCQSESGGESVETHSVFFSSFRKKSLVDMSADMDNYKTCIRLPGNVIESETKYGRYNPRSYLKALDLGGRLRVAAMNGN